MDALPISAVAEERLQRAEGEIRLAIKRGPQGSAVATRYERGAGRIRLIGRNPALPPEAVLINSAGGLTAGDRFRISVELAPGTTATVASQAAERIYRCAGGSARIDASLTVGAGANLAWLPQETILFDGAALRRTLNIDCAADSRLIAVETVCLGRTAMGERLRRASFRDAWTVNRGGRLILADRVRLEGDAEALMRGDTTGKGAVAFASLLMVAPDAEAQLGTARGAFTEAEVEAGASAWNGMLFARLASRSALALRRELVRLVEALRGVPMPRVWNC